MHIKVDIYDPENPLLQNFTAKLSFFSWIYWYQIDILVFAEFFVMLPIMQGFIQILTSEKDAIKDKNSPILRTPNSEFRIKFIRWTPQAQSSECNPSGQKRPPINDKMICKFQF